MREDSDPADWITCCQPRDEDVLTAFQDRLGAMDVGRWKDNCLASLGSNCKIERGKTGLPATEVFIQITKYSEVSIVDIQACIRVRHVKPSRQIPHKVRTLESLEVSTPDFPHQRSNNSFDFQIEFLLNLRPTWRSKSKSRSIFRSDGGLVTFTSLLADCRFRPTIRMVDRLDH